MAENFDQAYQWMGFVHHSYAAEGKSQVEGAPVAGRVCEFSDNPNGLKAVEKILTFDAKQREFQFDVVPFNAPKRLPIVKNLVTLRVVPLGELKSRVVWRFELEISRQGYVIYPLLYLGLARNFAQVLKDLKAFAQGPGLVEQDALHH